MNSPSSSPGMHFSIRVQQVMQHSREEAIRFGHDYIGTEHLLLGIIRLGDGFAVEILKRLGCDLDEIRKTIEEMFETPSKTTTTDFIPFTTRAEKVFRTSHYESRSYSSSIIGTEHLLLAILLEKDSMAANVLNSFNIFHEDVSSHLFNPQRPSEPIVSQDELQKLLIKFPLSKRSWNILKESHTESLLHSSIIIRSEHLLSAILKEKDSTAEKILSHLGITENKIKEALETIRRESC